MIWYLRKNFVLISKESNHEIKRINPEFAARSRVKLTSAAQVLPGKPENNKEKDNKFNNKIKNLEEIRKSAQEGTIASLKRKNDEFI
jgi:hypothetical protein